MILSGSSPLSFPHFVLIIVLVFAGGHPALALESCIIEVVVDIKLLKRTDTVAAKIFTRLFHLVLFLHF